MDLVKQSNPGSEATFSQQCQLYGTCPQTQNEIQSQVFMSFMNRTYGDDIAAMARDTKINKMQHSRSVLYKLVEAYKVYGELAKVKAFHAPKKSC